MKTEPLIPIDEIVAMYTDARRAGLAEGIGLALERVVKRHLKDGSVELGDVAEEIATEAVRILGDTAREEFKRRRLTIITCAKSDVDPTET